MHQRAGKKHPHLVRVTVPAENKTPVPTPDTALPSAKQPDLQLGIKGHAKSLCGGGRNRVLTRRKSLSPTKFLLVHSGTKEAMLKSRAFTGHILALS